MRHSMLQARMWDALGILRSAQRMQAGLDVVLGLKRDLATRGAADAAAIRPWYELGFMCSTAELALTSALFRTESRAAHFREDFPNRDDLCWSGSVTVSGRRGAMAASFSPRRAIDHAA
jgi:succinate dehydrogenase/fumarate reductase flavoprotein subunit